MKKQTHPIHNAAMLVILIVLTMAAISVISKII